MLYRRRLSIGVSIVCSLLALGVLWPRLSQAAQFWCWDGACVQRAVATANANGEMNQIVLTPGTHTLEAPLPPITSYLFVVGYGQGVSILERAVTAPRFRHFVVPEGGTLVLMNVTLQGGDVVSDGGALRVSGTAWLDGVALLDNRAYYGGGMVVLGPHAKAWVWRSHLQDNIAFLAGGGLAVGDGAWAVVVISTVAGNIAQGGGGLANVRIGERAGMLYVHHTSIVENISVSTPGGGLLNDGGLDLVSSTVAHNRVVGSWSGSGVANAAGWTIIRNSTIAANTHSEGETRKGGLENSSGAILYLANSIVTHHTNTCLGTFTSVGGNVFGPMGTCSATLHPTDQVGDPGFAPFVDEGPAGRAYYALEHWSQAVDAARDIYCPATDQLGHRRVRQCDSGAVEFQGAGEAVSRRDR